MSAFLCFPLSSWKKHRCGSKILNSGTSGSLTKANVKSCSSSPTTSRTDWGKQIRKKLCRRDEGPGAHAVLCQDHVWMLSWGTGTSLAESSRGHWGGQGWGTQGEAEGARLVQPGRGTEETGPDTFLEVQGKRIGSHGAVCNQGKLQLDVRQSWVALVPATVEVYWTVCEHSKWEFELLVQYRLPHRVWAALSKCLSLCVLRSCFRGGLVKQHSCVCIFWGFCMTELRSK